jgi:Intracellular multiplication and human macrophage-killing
MQSNDKPPASPAHGSPIPTDPASALRLRPLNEETLKQWVELTQSASNIYGTRESGTRDFDHLFRHYNQVAEDQASTLKAIQERRGAVAPDEGSALLQQARSGLAAFSELKRMYDEWKSPSDSSQGQPDTPATSAIEADIKLVAQAHAAVAALVPQKRAMSSPEAPPAGDIATDVMLPPRRSADPLHAQRPSLDNVSSRLAEPARAATSIGPPPGVRPKL